MSHEEFVLLKREFLSVEATTVYDHEAARLWYAIIPYDFKVQPIREANRLSFIYALLFDRNRLSLANSYFPPLVFILRG